MPYKLVMEPYDQALRKRIVKALEQGSSISEVSRRYEVHRHTVRRLRDRFEQTGSLEPLARGGRRVSRIEPYRDQIREWIRQQSDMTLAELRQRLLDRCGVEMSISTLGYHLNRMELSYKKNATRQRAGSP